MSQPKSPHSSDDVPSVNPEDVSRLEEELARMRIQLKEQQKQFAERPPKSLVVATGRQLTIFKDKPLKVGDTSLEEWLLDVKCTVEARKLSDEEHALLLCQHLGGRARQEILARGSSVKESPKEIIKVLRKVFGGGSDLPTAQHRFYSHRQKPGQDLITLSLDLIDLYDHITDIEPAFSNQRKSALKSQFAEAASNDTIKREIRRLTKEQPDLEFLDLRDRLIEWSGSNITAARDKASVEEHHINMDDIVRRQAELIEKQQQQINELMRHKQRGRRERKCWTCGQPGHMQRNCQARNNQSN
ncbi:uncharacterized protein [Haliotis asinina]|uniref:uncharacterized protein n=1 Tax=Haliotis asinina TaxID=109174 RepID=UPI003531AAEE